MMGASRIITSIIVLPVLAYAVMTLRPLHFALLLALVAGAALYEFYAMYRVRGPLLWTGLLAGVLLPVASSAGVGLSAPLAAAVMAVTVVRLLGKKDSASALGDTAPVIFGLLYVPVLLTFVVGLREGGPEWVLFLFGTVWGADAAAYYVGTWVGGRKLYESVSPKKTVAGACGSLVGGALAGLALCALMLRGFPLHLAALAGALIGGVTVVGDLVESMYKRDAGVKDSGAIVPAHGGVLDKLDGSLFAGPVLYWFLRALADQLR